MDDDQNYKVTDNIVLDQTVVTALIRVAVLLTKNWVNYFTSIPTLKLRFGL